MSQKCPTLQAETTDVTITVRMWMQPAHFSTLQGFFFNNNNNNNNNNPSRT
jgi:hypothetical protein